MADKKIELVLELKNNQYVAAITMADDKTKKFKKNVDSQSSGISGSFKSILFAAKAYLGLALAKYFIDLAGRFDDVKSSYQNLTSSLKGGGESLLKSIQIAAKGTVSQLDIMKSSNLAITLMGEGVAEYLPRMMEIARSTAATQGVEVSQMYNDIIVASGRQSVMILDNLGISSVTAGKFMEEYAKKLGKTRMTLDDTQKRAAFFYAVMKAGGEIVDKTGSESLTFGQRVQVIKAQVEDAATSLTQKMLPGLEAVTIALTSVDSEGESLVSVTGKWLSNLLVMFAAVIQQAKNLPAAFSQVAKNIKDIASGNSEFVQVRNQFEEYWSKADPKEAVAHIRKYEKALLNAGFSKEYLEGKVNVLVAQGKYSWNQGEMKQDKKPAILPKTGSTGQSNNEDGNKKREEQSKILDKFRQYGMSDYEKLNDNYQKDLEEFAKITDEKLRKTEEYAAAREAIEKKHQDAITDYAIDKTQKWLGFGSTALGEISNLYNMAANNRISKLDEQYAKEVETVNNSLMTDEQKEAKLAILEAKYEADKKKVQLENAKRQKKIALMQAIVDLPAAVIATFRNMGGWPWGVVPAGIMAGIGAKKIQMIKDQPVALAKGGVATDATLAWIAEGKYDEAILPLSSNTYQQLGAGIEKAQSRNIASTASAGIINHYYQYTFQGSYYDKDGFDKAVSESNLRFQRRTGVDVYSRKSVY